MSEPTGPSAADSGDPDGAPSGVARRLLLVAAVIVVVESLGYLTLAGLDLRDMDWDRWPTGLGIAVLLAGYGIAQLIAMRMLLLGRAGARAPLIVTQLLQALVATGLRDQPMLAAAIGVPPVIVLAILVSPPVNRAFADRA